MYRFIELSLLVVSAVFVLPSILLTVEGSQAGRGIAVQKQDDKQQEKKQPTAEEKAKSLTDTKLKAHAAVTRRLMRVVHRGKQSPFVVFQKAIEVEENASPDWDILETQADWVEVMGIALAEPPIPNGKTYLEMSMELKEAIDAKDFEQLKKTVQIWDKSCVRCHSGWGGAPK